MSQLSNYAENALYNHVLRNTPVASPVTLYLAACLSDPGEDDSGTEVSASGYVRKPVTFGAPVGGVGENSADVVFDEAVADWGSVTHWKLMDAESAGNMWMYGALDTPVTILAGDTHTAPEGMVDVSLAVSYFSTYLRNKLYDHIFRNTAYTSPAALYDALYNTNPTVDDTGTELSGGSYARQAITFSAPVDGGGSNAADVDFGAGTADHGTVTHTGVRDALTGGNLLIFSAFGTAKPYNTTSTHFRIKAGMLALSIA